MSLPHDDVGGLLFSSCEPIHWLESPKGMLVDFEFGGINRESSDSGR